MIGDRGRIIQVLLNLLLNSIKFTKEGKISLFVFKGRPSKNLVTFKVTDTGDGIS